MRDGANDMRDGANYFLVSLKIFLFWRGAFAFQCWSGWNGCGGL